MPRFFDPWQGRVLVDGHDVRDLQLHSLRRQVALVLQEPFLFPFTVADNIAYGRPEASRREIEAAARTANAHEFIERLPQGYDTVIGERGVTLSGGERQRLSIARALLKDAPILILDEPTSALDAETETRLVEALKRLMAGRTTFIIAHRLSTVRRANCILVLKDGQIAERGTHQQLLARGKAYAHLHEVQFGIKLPVPARLNGSMTSHSTTPDLSLTRLCRWVLRYALRRRLPLLAVVLTMLFQVGLAVLKPWPLKFLLDHVLGTNPMPAALRQLVDLLPGAHSPTNLIGWSVGATVLIFLLGWAVSLANEYAGISLGQRMTYDLAADLLARLQQLSLRFHTSKSVGDNIRRVTADCACISTILKDALLPVLSSTVTLIMMFGIMWGMNIPLTLLSLAVVPFMVWVFRRYNQPMMDLSYKQQQIESQIYAAVEQTFSAMPAVQAFCREPLNDQRFVQINRDTLAATMTLTRVELWFKILMGLATAIGTAAIMWFGARLGLGEPASPGTIVLFLSYLSSLYAPLESMMYTLSTIQAATGSARRVLEVMETEREIVDKPGAVPISSARGQVEIEGVSFGYEPSHPVLRGVSLQVQPGESVALVGATGAGKTTLVGLLPRFFDPWQGQVRLDGRDIRDFTLKSLRSQIAIVLQEPFLFPLTIAENIAYGRLQATTDEIEAAARDARAHEFITKLPEGYQTLIGERGATLSVGQRQRLSIARALLKNAPILILDEPTSALDAETEQLLMEALERLMAQRTTFIIAHRLSTVRRASRIVFLKDGVVAETGTHQQLLARGGLYAGFYTAQFDSGSPSSPRGPS